MNAPSNMSSNVLHQSSSYTFADHSTEQEVDFEGISNLCFNYYQLKTSIELAYRLLSSLPRARLASIQRRIAPLLQFDVVAVRIQSTSNSISEVHETCSPFRQKSLCKYSRIYHSKPS